MTATASDLRSKVAFYTRGAIASPPDYGQAEGEWSLTAEFECAANIVPKLGSEKVLADRLSGVNLVNITVRQSTASRAVTTAYKVVDVHKNVEYNIRSIIDPDQGTVRQGSYFEMLCEQGVAS